ncbi:MAG: DUF2723 domain-containing protein [Elusimicrobia bacterium]|nr:DUF2723 domain-containing protein [Elusimicrobiota bacterium]
MRGAVEAGGRASRAEPAWGAPRPLGEESAGRGGFLVFAAFFGLYLWTMPPALPPYRDAGEMTTSAATLGISHPTGYPLYILLGRASQALPAGNKAYRTNLLSVIAGAGALGLLYGLAAGRWGALAGLGGAAALGFSPVFWSVCLVTEMYSLWVLGAVALVALAWRLRDRHDRRLWLGFCWLYGLALTNRMDLVLLAPGLLWLALGSSGDDRPREDGLWAMLALACFPAVIAATDSKAPVALLIVGTALWRAPKAGRGRWVAASLAFALLGLGLNAYLPVRSAGHPWLDWNHPAKLSNLADTLLRSRYGGTLDLLSKSYAKGELLLPNMVVYGRHLWESFGLAGLLLAVFGGLRLAFSDRGAFLGLAAAYWWCGPFFLFLANMPPNPHALAIVEPHYLLSDLVLALWLACGIGELRRLRQALACAAVAALLLVPFFKGRFAAMDRRAHFFSYDYAKNVLKSVPPGAVLVSKKDVQLYTLWHYQTVQGWRPDVRLVAQGLAGAPWYQSDWRRRDAGLWLGPLRDSSQWRMFVGANPAAFATPDAEVPPEVTPRRQNGLVTALGGASAGVAPERGESWKLFALRGDYRYETQPDFFTSDIIGDCSRALFFAGGDASKEGAADAASAMLLRAWGMHWLFPEASTLLGYLEFARNDYGLAKEYYGLSVSLYGVMLELAREYRALPGLLAEIASGAAESTMHLGVIAERTGDRAAAERHYLDSLELRPLAQTRFNMAVLYWNRDRGRAERELSEALRLDPSHAEAARYLAILRSRLPPGRPEGPR